ncbi:hypothetical protein ASG87_03510 [Frateuria sp. Soil773]|uniref:hypothetical protein n=1 Tax=Frateuria sp. Soil773 TaxID=1736407 RepID=UPI000702229A|nr:hypothetical protein [Frateuria sp. Soil773]KRE89419.1 hypothetical protein ASG87_03510 [Frateuria sp. Soil773]
MTALLSAELAWYVTGRFYRANDGSLADYGYFLHLAGIEADLFDGRRHSAATAHFTFAARPFVAHTHANGALCLAFDADGDFSVYLQRAPAGNFDDPASFAAGERIATFRRVGVVVGTTVEAGTAEQPLVSSNVFSARLVDSVPFEFAGRRYDLARILGRGVTQFGTAATTPVVPAPPGYQLVVPFAGSAVALGGA